MAHGFTEIVLSRMFSVEVGTVSRKLEEAAKAVTRLGPRFVQMPMGAEADRVARGFAALRRGRPCLDNVVGAVGCMFTFVTRGEQEHGHFTNVKHHHPGMLLTGVCDHNLKFRWYSAESVASIGGEQAAATESDLAPSSSSGSARVAATRSPQPLLAAASACDALPGADVPPEAMALAERRCEAMWGDASSRPAVPAGKVLVSNGGVQDYDWMLRVGDMNDAKAVKRLSEPDDERRQLQKLAYCNVVVSSHQIHVERAFGRFLNSFKIFRGGRFSEDKMRLFLDAAMVAYNFIITELEAAEAPTEASPPGATSAPAAAAAAAASVAFAAPTAAPMAQPAVNCLDDDTETLALAAASLHQLAGNITGMGEGMWLGPPVMALANSEASKAIMAYVREVEEAGLPLFDKRFTVSAPELEAKVSVGLSAGPEAVGECMPGMYPLLQRRFMVMESLFAARTNYAIVTSVLDADSHVRQASANMSKAVSEAEDAGCVTGAAAAVDSSGPPAGDI